MCDVIVLLHSLPIVTNCHNFTNSLPLPPSRTPFVDDPWIVFFMLVTPSVEVPCWYFVLEKAGYVSVGHGLRIACVEMQQCKHWNRGRSCFEWILREFKNGCCILNRVATYLGNGENQELSGTFKMTSKVRKSWFSEIVF